LSFYILLAHQTQNLHKEKPIPSMCKAPTSVIVTLMNMCLSVYTACYQGIIENVLLGSPHLRSGKSCLRCQVCSSNFRWSKMVVCTFS